MVYQVEVVGARNLIPSKDNQPIYSPWCEVGLTGADGLLFLAKPNNIKSQLVFKKIIRF